MKQENYEVHFEKVMYIGDKSDRQKMKKNLRKPTKNITGICKILTLT